MSFAAVLPIAGYAGWKFLGRTIEAQKAAFAGSPVTKRDEAYFREKIGSIKTAEALVGDRRLLGVALAAFGLEGDINNKAFIRKVLEDGTLNPKDLANRLVDKRYLEFSKTFGFGDYAVPSTQLSDFADKIIAARNTRGFETAVGEQNGDMRAALNAQRELPALAAKANSANTKWFIILGSPPLRKVFETAFGLSRSFGSIDLDQQLGVFKDRAKKMLGISNPAEFTDPKKVEDLVRTFLLRSDGAGASLSTTKNSAALTLLQSSGGATAANNILSLLR